MVKKSCGSRGCGWPATAGLWGRITAWPTGTRWTCCPRSRAAEEVRYAEVAGACGAECFGSGPLDRLLSRPSWPAVGARARAGRRLPPGGHRRPAGLPGPDRPPGIGEGHAGALRVPPAPGQAPAPEPGRPGLQPRGFRHRRHPGRLRPPAPGGRELPQRAGGVPARGLAAEGVSVAIGDLSAEAAGARLAGLPAARPAGLALSCDVLDRESVREALRRTVEALDRKSTRLNSSHGYI